MPHYPCSLCGSCSATPVSCPHIPLRCLRAGQQRGRQQGGPTISPQGRQLLKELQQEGMGDHILLLRLYEVSTTD